MKELIEALAKAKKEFKPIVMTGFNPVYHSKYATRQDILEAVTEALSNNGLVLVHLLEAGADDNHPILVTKLIHTSGEYLESRLTLDFSSFDGKTKYQAIGSALTYAMRYSTIGILCISGEEEDDGNIADNIPVPSYDEAAKEIGMTDEDIAKLKRQYADKFSLIVSRRREAVKKIAEKTGLDFQDIVSTIKKAGWALSAELVRKASEQPKEQAILTLRQIETLRGGEANETVDKEG